MSATREIVRWIVSTHYNAIPSNVVEAANVSSFDCVGTILAGSDETLGKIITDYVAAGGGKEESSVLGTKTKVPAPMAAMANGTLAHSMDFDNAGGFGHPAAVLFPALLALSEARSMSGKSLLESYVIGCEVGFALYYNGGGKNVFPQMKKGFHATSVFGRIAAAAACSKLLRLDETQTQMALGIAGSMASGLVHNFGSMTKSLHAGMTARDGVMAAELAAKGWTAGEDIIEQDHGFMKSFFGDALNVDSAISRLGKPFLSSQMYSIKKYPTCGHNNSVIQSLSGLMKEHRFTADVIERVDILASDPNSEVVLFSTPRNALEARFSVRYNAAAVLLQGDLSEESFSDSQVSSPQIQEIIRKVFVNERPANEFKNSMSGSMPVKVSLITERFTSVPPCQ